MQLHTIKPFHRGKRSRRIGRGGKRGTYSGRGIKGQRARAGAKIRPAIRDFIKETPKLRGQEFPALPNKPKATPLNLDDIKKKFPQGGMISRKTLHAAGLLKSAKTPVKLLGKGEAPPKLLLRGIPVSQSARKKIEGAGGTIE
jgi:large subunit ribosomal protein L15